MIGNPHSGTLNAISSSRDHADIDFGSIMIDTRVARNAKRTALYRFPPAETRFRSPAWQNEVPSLTYALSPTRSKRTHFLPSPPPEIVESCLKIEFCVCFFQPRSTAADSSGHGTAVSSLSIHFLHREARSDRYG